VWVCGRHEEVPYDVCLSSRAPGASTLHFAECRSSQGAAQIRAAGDPQQQEQEKRSAASLATLAIGLYRYIGQGYCPAPVGLLFMGGHYFCEGVAI
jgi:hypothetical protein